MSIPPLKLSNLISVTQLAKHSFDHQLILDIAIKPYDNRIIMVYVDKPRQQPPPAHIAS